MFHRNARVRGRWIAVGMALVAVALATRAMGPAAGAADESAVLEELNLAREKPAEYAAYLEDYRRNYKGPAVVLVDGRKFRTTEGVAAVDEAIAFLKTVSPAPALTASASLAQAAQDHARDIGSRGTIGHTGSDGSRPEARMARYARVGNASGEAIAFGPISPRSIVIQLIVDDGVPDRGHRTTVFNPRYRVAGIALGPHTAHDAVCVITFADRVDGTR